MPGPCSAPNGERKLIDRHPQDGKQPITGKTDLKHKKIIHAREKTFKNKMTRARIERELEGNDYVEYVESKSLKGEL